MRRGAVILCGGKSSRMGRAKALLPFGPELMLQRVVRLVGEVVPTENIVVVSAAGQELPSLPDNVVITHDARDARGPLEGLAAGLTALGDRVDAAFVTSCDVPLLLPAFVERLFQLLGYDNLGDNFGDNLSGDKLADHDIVVPRDGKFHHPLAAVYRVSVLDHVKQLLAADRLRPFFLFELAKTREISVDELRTVDPDLVSLENLNHPEEYHRALRRCGFEAPGDD